MSRYVTFQNLEQVGRLGNQLFQIAWTIGTARESSRHPLINPNWTYRPYFNIPEEMYGVPNGDHDVLDGGTEYFQEYKYFKHCADYIQDIFQPAQKTKDHLFATMVKELVVPNVCALHVRRGDYLKYPNHFPLPTPAYYAACTADQRKKDPAVTFAVFSDDINWCEANEDKIGLLPSDSVVYVRGNAVTPVEVAERVAAPTDQNDLFIISLCDNLIMSNSTFAYWGGYLGHYMKHIYYPSVWFGSELPDINWKAMFPTGSKWKMMPC